MATADKQADGLGSLLPNFSSGSGGGTSFYLTQSLRFSAVIAGTVSAELKPLLLVTERVLGTRRLQTASPHHSS